MQGPDDLKRMISADKDLQKAAEQSSQIEYMVKAWLQEHYSIAMKVRRRKAARLRQRQRQQRQLNIPDKDRLDRLLTLERSTSQATALTGARSYEIPPCWEKCCFFDVVALADRTRGRLFDIYKFTRQSTFLHAFGCKDIGKWPPVDWISTSVRSERFKLLMLVLGGIQGDSSQRQHSHRRTDIDKADISPVQRLPLQRISMYVRTQTANTVQPSEVSLSNSANSFVPQTQRSDVERRTRASLMARRR
ncbi:hypothetical protein MBM_09441 [Drepanopeziza brunnea f. sp. 'multigermtubi' MB_m1]|uniref:Uncharacterized protein n=2 Tax=Drepanopeziza brunnea f. sp. 'multigermtubi' TaxID=698441 RepID=K1WJJ7_MARBU|nr:uncharacterized protein MBM_09441 [Drepanopeziza brunnea f. sp. 'multigermtubi' MB_m1]EKD12407.1 hypothetical protein MBM_09441 [Drepanopeziza brunnea f. sp. 'multigermtubi' MB_m1]